MIIQEGGRSWSVRTFEEELGLYEKDLEALSDDELEALHALLSEPEVYGTTDLYRAANDAEYESVPVGVEEFLRHPDYMGGIGKNLYPILMDDMVELFEGGYSEVILTGSLGWGKTYFCSLACLYVLYQMSCLRNPQLSYGIDEGSHIALSFLSVTEKSARRTVFSEMVTKLNRSPYFQEVFPYKEHISEVKFFKKPIMLVAGSTTSNAILSLNIFGGIIDEGNFLGKVKGVKQKASRIRWEHIDKAERMYHTVIRRMKSRYMRSGKLPGILFMPSSKTVVSSFTETRIKESLNDPTIFVRDYSTWDVKKRAGMFNRGKFKLLVGNERIRSKILEPGDEEEYGKVEGVQIIEVPEDYRKDFERDIETAIQEIAGMSTLGLSLYFQRSEKLWSMFHDHQETLEHPFTVSEWQVDKPGGFVWERIARRVKRRLPGGFIEDAWEPILNPHAIRHVRLDPSLTGDATGIAVGHVAGYFEVVRRDQEGREYNEIAPKILIDFVLRIVPPVDDEIMLGTARMLIYQLVEHGFSVEYASSDSYQSVDTKQKLKQRGIDCEIFSVEKAAQYQTLKTAIYEDRLFCYPYPIALDELKFLEYDATTGKVDHPEDGSKDVADAICGLVCSLTERNRQAPMPPSVGSDHGHVEEDDSWVTDGWKPSDKDKSGSGGDSGGGNDGGLPPMPFMG